MSLENVCCICFENKNDMKRIISLEKHYIESINLLKHPKFNTKWVTDKRTLTVCNECFFVTNIVSKYTTKEKFLCFECPRKYFETFDELKLHLIDHKERLGCKLCDKIYKTHTLLNKHKHDHIFCICMECKKLYIKSKFEEHKHTHQSLYTLEQLNDIVSIINQLNSNTSNTNNTSTLTTIVDNPISTSTLNQALNPINNNSALIPRCPVCHEEFPTPNKLIDHFINHKTYHTCNFCNEIFPQRKHLLQHEEQKVCKFYTCPTCNRQFSVGSFVNHIMKICSGKFIQDAIETPMDIEMNCETQNDSLTLNSNLTLNMNAENITNNISNFYSRSYVKFPPKIYLIENERYFFQCHICKLKLNNLNFLLAHLKIHDKTIKICLKCLSIFESQSELTDHIYSKKKSCKNADLTILTRIQQNCLRRQIDNYMKSTNSQSSNVKSKQRKNNIECSIDTSIKQNYCGKPLVFIELKSLTEHLKTYNKELISCPECFSIFELNSELIKHICKSGNDNISEIEFRLRENIKILLKCENEYKSQDDCFIIENEIIKIDLCDSSDSDIREDNIFEDNVINIDQNNNIPVASESNYLLIKNITRELYTSNNIMKRINKLHNNILNEIKDMKNQNKKTKNKSRIKRKYKKEVTNINVQITNDPNDAYDLRKILPRVLELRTKLSRNNSLNETASISKENLSSHILKKKNYVAVDDMELQEPLIKKIKIDSNFENSLSNDFQKLNSELSKHICQSGNDNISEIEFRLGENIKILLKHENEYKSSDDCLIIENEIIKIDLCDSSNSDIREDNIFEANVINIDQNNNIPVASESNYLLTQNITRELYTSNNIMKRINKLHNNILKDIKDVKNQNKKTKNKPRIKHKYKKEVTNINVQITNDPNDAYNLRKILPRILELRTKLSRNNSLNETASISKENVSSQILKKKNYVADDDMELQEPLNKKIKIDSNFENSLSNDFLTKFQKFLVTNEKTDDLEPSPNKKVKL